MQIMSVINFNYIKDYKKWSYSDFAREFGISPQGARVYFKDRQAPVDLAILVCEMMNISLDYIYRYELTEAVLKSGDPYYINNNPVSKASESDSEYRKKLELGAVNGLEEMLRNIVRQEMKKNEPDKPSKAS